MGLLAGSWALPAPGLDPSKQISQYRLRTWSLDEGLPQSTVSTIAQTPDGYLWLGTLAGLVRFDGVRFVGPEAWVGLPRASVETVVTDGAGRLWIETEGLYRSAGDRFEEVRFNGQRILDLGALVPREVGGLWVGRVRGPLLVADEDGGIRPFVDRSGQTILGVTAASDRSGRTCFVSNAGVQCLIDGVAEVVAEFSEVAPRRSLVEALLIDADGALWVGTLGEGVVRIQNGVIDRRLDRAGGLLEGEVRVLAPDRHGTIWIADGSTGLVRLSGPRREHLEVHRGVRTIRSFFEDREGNLWLGSNSEGLAQLRDPPITVFSTPEGLPLPVVHAVLASGSGSTWLGLEGGGLAEIRQGAVVRVLDGDDGLPSPDVMSLAEDREGRLLVGTAGGVVRLARGDGVPVALPLEGAPQTFSLFEDSRGRLWGGFLREVRRFEGGAFRGVPWGREMYTAAIAETADGTVWFGGSPGLLRFRNGRGERVELTGGRTEPLVLALLADGEDLWLGTLGLGLGRWSSSGFASLGRAEGLCDDEVFSLLDDGNGRLWMSSNRGIFAVAAADALEVLDGSKATLECRLFGRVHGMRQREAIGGTQPSAWRDAEGRLWFATIDGVVRFDPAALLAESPPPGVVVEELRAGDLLHRAPDPAVGLTLGPSHRELEIDYTALHLGAPEALSFRYRLRGVSDDWVEAGARRTAYYPNLGPGEYGFEVVARIGDGRWGAPGRLAVTLEPRFVETRLFFGALAGVFLLAVAAVYRSRSAQLRQRQRLLEAAVGERTADLEAARRDLEQANSTLERRVEQGVAALRDADRMAAYGHLVAGVAHELRHPLAAVQTAAHLLSTRFEASADARQEVELLSQESARIQRLLDDLLELARPDHPTLIPTDLRSLLDEVAASYEAACAGDGGERLPIEMQVDAALPSIAAEREKLVRMLLNLLHNARRHAGAGRVIVRAEVVGAGSGAAAVLRLSVADDGVGIPVSRQATLFEPFVSGSGGTGLGLAIARRIAETHGGSIRVESEVGRGATFVVELPVA